MINAELKSPHDFTGRGTVRTDRRLRTDHKFDFKGKLFYGVQAAELAGELRSILEALQHAHCETNPVVVRVTKDELLESGTIYAWTAESLEIAEIAVSKIHMVIAKLRELPLTSFEVFVKFTLEQTLAADA